MEIAFDAIGLEIPNETAYHDLAENAGTRGEASRLPRKSGVLHGRCWKLGLGLEVWTVLYESPQTGEVFYADCRPGFRARYRQRVSPWIATEFDEEGEAVVHGFIEDTEREVLFALQNLTEVGAGSLQQNTLTVGLCGLAYRAEVLEGRNHLPFWKAYDELALNVVENENDWSLCGRIASFSALRNPLSGTDLYWIYLDLGDFNLEILVNSRTLSGAPLKEGSTLRADIWLQGHILHETPRRSFYEGVDRSGAARTVDFWKKFKKVN
jgi:hypothetical protein